MPHVLGHMEGTVWDASQQRWVPNPVLLPADTPPPAGLASLDVAQKQGAGQMVGGTLYDVDSTTGRPRSEEPVTLEVAPKTTAASGWVDNMKPQEDDDDIPTYDDTDYEMDQKILDDLDDATEDTIILDDRNPFRMPSDMRKYFDEMDEEAKLWAAKLIREYLMYEDKLSSIQSLLSFAASKGYSVPSGVLKSLVKAAPDKKTSFVGEGTRVEGEREVEEAPDEATGFADSADLDDDIGGDDLPRPDIHVPLLVEVEDIVRDLVVQFMDLEDEEEKERLREVIRNAVYSQDEEERERLLGIIEEYGLDKEGLFAGVSEPTEETGAEDETGVEELTEEGEVEEGEELTEEQLEERQKITDWIKDGTIKVKDTIMDVFRGIWGGMTTPPDQIIQETLNNALGTRVGVVHNCEEGPCKWQLEIFIGLPIPGLTGKGLRIDITDETGQLVIDDKAKAKIQEVWGEIQTKIEELPEKISNGLKKIFGEVEAEGGEVKETEQDEEGNIILTILDKAGNLVKKILTPAELIGLPTTAGGVGGILGKGLVLYGVGQLLDSGGGKGKTLLDIGRGQPDTSSGEDPFVSKDDDGPDDEDPDDGPDDEDPDDDGPDDGPEDDGPDDEDPFVSKDDDGPDDEDPDDEDPPSKEDDPDDEDPPSKEDGPDDEDPFVSGTVDDVRRQGTFSDVGRQGTFSDIFTGGVSRADDTDDDDPIVSTLTTDISPDGGGDPFFSILGQPQGGMSVIPEDPETGEIEYFYDWASIFANPEQARRYGEARPTMTDVLMDRLVENKKNLNKISKMAENMMKEPLTGIPLRKRRVT